MRDRKEDKIDELTRLVQRLTLEQGELAERNRQLERNQEELSTQNRLLTTRVRVLKVGAAQSAVGYGRARANRRRE